MRYCPNCKRDFEDGTLSCKWCEVELVDSLTETKDIVAEKLRRELLPTEEELKETATDFFSENADTVTIYSAFDVMQAAEIEKALKKAGIPVLVKPAEPLEDKAEEAAEAVKETVEETVEAVEEAVGETVEEAAEEVAETVEAPAKKGFFARLFGKKEKDRPLPKDDILFGGDEEEFTYTPGEMLDVIVPAAVEAEAVTILNGVLGIEAEQEVAAYTDEELAD